MPSAPTPAGLVAQLQDLPPAPRVLHTLQRLIATPDTTIERLAGVVTLEPGLSARVVRMANSAHFRRGERIETIDEAIQRIGIDGVHELVTYAVASQLVGQPLATYRLDAQSLWSRAVACAIAAATLAEHAGMDRSDAYTVGLMHGLGLVAIDRHAAQSEDGGSRRLASAGYPEDFAPAERAWLGFSHAEVGAALLELWGFPNWVVMPVHFQLRPDQAPAEHRPLSMMLATARWARTLLCVPDEIIPELPSPLWLEEAGLKIDDFDWWLSEVRRRFELACTELGLP